MIVCYDVRDAIHNHRRDDDIITGSLPIDTRACGDGVDPAYLQVLNICRAYLTLVCIIPVERVVAIWAKPIRARILGLSKSNHRWCHEKRHNKNRYHSENLLGFGEKFQRERLRIAAHYICLDKTSHRCITVIVHEFTRRQSSTSDGRHWADGAVESD